MEDDDLTVGKSSKILSPFKWKSFKHIKRDYNLYREYLGSKIVILNHTNTAFKKNPDGSIDYQTQINFDDLIQIISETSPRTEILRYSENESDVNSCLIVNLNSFSEMQNIRKNIFKKYPYLSLDFIENSDL